MKVNHATVQRARMRYHASGIDCDVLQGIGWFARCRCGYAGPLHRDPDRARADQRAHVCDRDRELPHAS